MSDFRWCIMRNKALIPCLGNSHSHSVMPRSHECYVFFPQTDKKWSYLQELDVIFKCLMISNLLCHSGIIKPWVFFTGISLLEFWAVKGICIWDNGAQWWHFALAIVCWHLNMAVSTDCVIALKSTTRLGNPFNSYFFDTS